MRVVYEIDLFTRSAMGATEDPELMKETFQFILNRARDQDVVYFFRGLSVNSTARRPVFEFFKNEYDKVSLGGLYVFYMD
jgi:hypothetical protein